MWCQTQEQAHPTGFFTEDVKSKDYSTEELNNSVVLFVNLKHMQRSFYSQHAIFGTLWYSHGCHV